MRTRTSTCVRQALLFLRLGISTVLLGAYVGMQTGGCEGCTLPDFTRMVVGGIVGGIIVWSAIPQQWL